MRFPQVYICQKNFKEFAILIGLWHTEINRRIELIAKASQGLSPYRNGALTLLGCRFYMWSFLQQIGNIKRKTI